MCSLASPQKWPPWKGQWSTLHSTARCCMELLCLCSLPAHSCWLTHCWVTRIPLLAQGLMGQRQAGVRCLALSSSSLSTAAQHWRAHSPPQSNMSADLTARLPLTRLFDDQSFLMQLINFLSPHELSIFFFDSHHPVALADSYPLLGLPTATGFPLCPIISTVRGLLCHPLAFSAFWTP